jgi:hypothetical protein
VKAYAHLVAALLSLLSAQAIACTCSVPIGDQPVTDTNEHWMSAFASSSEIIVLARVASVASQEPTHKEIAGTAVLEVRESFKSKLDRTITVKSSFCQGFPLKVGEVRVFFIGPKGTIRGCSEYRHRMDLEELLARLRRWRHGSAT